MALTAVGAVAVATVIACAAPAARARQGVAIVGNAAAGDLKRVDLRTATVTPQQSLDAKLAAAEQALADMNHGHVGSAINALNAFISECSAQRKKSIPEETADALIADALHIIDELD